MIPLILWLAASPIMLNAAHNPYEFFSLYQPGTPQYLKPTTEKPATPRQIEILKWATQDEKTWTKAEGTEIHSPILPEATLYWTVSVDRKDIEVDRPPKAGVAHVLIESHEGLLHAATPLTKDFLFCDAGQFRKRTLLRRDPSSSPKTLDMKQWTSQFCRPQLAKILHAFYGGLSSPGYSLVEWTRSLVELAMIMSAMNPRLSWVQDGMKPTDIKSVSEFAWEKPNKKTSLTSFLVKRMEDRIDFDGYVFVPANAGYGGTLYRVRGTISRDSLDLDFKALGVSRVLFGMNAIAPATLAVS